MKTSPACLCAELFRYVGRGTIAMLLPGAFMGCTPQDFRSNLGAAGTSPLSNDEVVSGLREALRVGTERSMQQAGAKDDFWRNGAIRIPFREEAIAVKNTLTGLGPDGPVEELERTLDRAAEQAAQEAAPVFVEAITGMSMQDGCAILHGGDQAATDLLRERTSSALRVRFLPKVEKITSEVALTAAWWPVVKAYNTTTPAHGRQGGGTRPRPICDGARLGRALHPACRGGKEDPAGPHDPDHRPAQESVRYTLMPITHTPPIA